MTAAGNATRMSDAWWWSALLFAVLLVLAINPVGYLGGGNDDWQYVNAANCWLEHGTCLPQDHWQARWPVVAPLALFMRLFGENRLAVSLPPLLASLSCLFLLAVVGNRAFGRPTGWVAALLLLLTPVFTVQLLEPSVESTELAFTLASAYCAVRWAERGGWRWPALAGLTLGLAVQVRETAFAATILIVFYALWRRRPTFSETFAAALGFLAPFAVEFTIFAISAGDPLWRRTLDLRHASIRSSELLGRVDTERPPFFNKDYIANWKREPGIHVYWAIDGLLNLFANPKSGLSLILAPVLAGWAAANGWTKAARQGLSLWAAAIVYAAVLIYALAIDPKPRMMIPALSLTCTALALLTWTMWQNQRRLFAGVLWAVQLGITVVLLIAFPALWNTDRVAADWLRARPAQAEIDENTRKQLQLVEGARALPDLDSDRRLFLYSSRFECLRWVTIAGLKPSDLRLLRQHYSSRLHDFDARLTGSLCLFAYNRPIGGSEMRQAIARSDRVNE